MSTPPETPNKERIRDGAVVVAAGAFVAGYGAALVLSVQKGDVQSVLELMTVGLALFSSVMVYVGLKTG